MSPQALAISYPATPDSVPTARRDVAGFAAHQGASDDKLEAVRLVVSEAVTNAVQHAYPGRPGLVHVDAAVDAGVLRVTVADEGPGGGECTTNPGLGLGFLWMQSFSDDLLIAESASGGMLVDLRFSLC